MGIITKRTTDFVYKYMLFLSKIKAIIMLSGKLNNKTGFQLPDIIVKKAVRIMDHLLKRGLSAPKFLLSLYLLSYRDIR